MCTCFYYAVDLDLIVEITHLTPVVGGLEALRTLLSTPTYHVGLVTSLFLLARTPRSRRRGGIVHEAARL